MRQVVLYIATSLDGKIARKDHSLDWLPMPEEEGEDYGYKDLMDSTDTLLMGYSTYEVCINLGEWPYKGLTTYVFSRSVNKAVIPDAQLVTEDPVTFTQNLLRTEGKNIWLVGGGDIIRQIHDAGLIDRYIITTIPVIIGEGIPLFSDIQKEQKLTLEYLKQYKDGLAMAYYCKNQS